MEPSVSEFFPVPADTWEQATDEHGFIVDETLPNVVFDQASFDRWKLCVDISSQITQLEADTVDTRSLAMEFFESPAATYDNEIEEGAVRGADRQVARELKRLKDGTFAPKGLGQILTPQRKSPGTGSPPSPQESDLSPQLRERIRNLGLDDRIAKPTSITHSVLGEGIGATVEKFAPTAKAHQSDSSDYLPERKALHDQILRDLLEGKTPPTNNEGEPQQPEAFFMAGGTASGKSTLLEDKESELRLPSEQHTVHIDPDKIKESLPEYRELLSRGDHFAAAAVHRESGDIARLALDHAIKSGLNVIIDGTGNSAPGQFVEQLNRMNDLGYAVDVVYADLPVKDAIEYTVFRAENEGRFVPIPVVRQIHKSVSQNFGEVANLPFLRRLSLYRRQELIAHKKGDSVEALRQDLFTAFLMKANAHG